MKIQLENINTDINSSFRIMHNPRLNDLFFWHFHPEYELIFIEGANGTRHVGDHISTYQESDLVFIGPNIPHLNFDYGVQTDYEKEVLHIKPSFKNSVFNETPELSTILQLFEMSQYGVVFFGDTKKQAGSRLKKLHQLSPFTQFIEVLHIFEILSNSNEFILLHKKPFVNKFSKKGQKRLQDIYSFIDVHYQKKIMVDEVAFLCNLSKPAFCRYFKKTTGKTFIGFLNQYRISIAKKHLLLGKNISETCYESGFESLSYFNRTFKNITNENPSAFKKKYLKMKNSKRIIIKN